jgi:hypothetical protein
MLENRNYSDDAILRKNPTNALIYVNTILFTLLHSTSFSPPEAIRREYCYIASAGSTQYVSRCKYKTTEQRVVRYVAFVKLMKECYSVNKEVLTYISALVRFLSKIVTSLRGYKQDTVISINSKCDRYYLAQNNYHVIHSPKC